MSSVNDGNITKEPSDGGSGGASSPSGSTFVGGSLYTAGTQALIDSTAAAALEWAPGPTGIFDDTHPTRIIAPEDGTYIVQGFFSLSGLTIFTEVDVQFKQYFSGGFLTSGYTIKALGPTITCQELQTNMQSFMMSAGDYLELEVGVIGEDVYGAVSNVLFYKAGASTTMGGPK